MKKRYSSTESYYIMVFSKMLEIAPLVGLSAALVFTAARLAGLFPFTGILELIGFDCACLSYFLAAHILKKRGILRDGRVNERDILIAQGIVVLIIVLQWNLISYIFPTRTFWGYAPMFVMLVAFMFKTQAVRWAITGISLSIIVSWFLKGELLLPDAGDYYMENLTLRIVALITTFTVIYLLTYFAEHFTRKVEENFREMNAKNEQLEKTNREIIDFAADLIEARDDTSGAHVRRLRFYTRVLAEQIAADWPEYGLTPEKIDIISLACVLHDVGKIGIPDSILKKPGKLTPEEFDLIKTHTVLGARIVGELPDSLGVEYKRCCRDVCQFHHEKYDGKGYPSGLRGEEIPIAAQIVSVIDCYDALTHERPYKSALPEEVAIRMILEGECGAFSEKIKSSLMACRERLN